MGTNFLSGLKTFNLFRLPENEALENFSKQERHKSKHKFGRNKVSKAEEVQKYFVNPIIGNKFFV